MDFNGILDVAIKSAVSGVSTYLAIRGAGALIDSKKQNSNKEDKGRRDGNNQ